MNTLFASRHKNKVEANCYAWNLTIPNVKCLKDGNHLHALAVAKSSLSITWTHECCIMKHGQKMNLSKVCRHTIVSSAIIKDSSAWRPRTTFIVWLYSWQQIYRSCKSMASKINKIRGVCWKHEENTYHRGSIFLLDSNIRLKVCW